MEHNAIYLGQNRLRLGSKPIFKYLKWTPRNKLGPKWPTKFEFSAKILICGQNTNSTVKPLKFRPNPLLFGLKITQKSHKERETPSLTNQKLIKSEIRVVYNSKHGEERITSCHVATIRPRASASALSGPTRLTWANRTLPCGTCVADASRRRSRTSCTHAVVYQRILT